MSGERAVRGAAWRRGVAALGAVVLVAMPAHVARPQGQAGEAQAGEVRATGRSLVVEAPCAAVVEVREDPFLLRTGDAGQVSLGAEPAGSGPGMSAGGDEVVRVGGACRRRAERLAVRVSPGMAVSLSGGAAWHVGAMGGAVDAALHGGEDADFGALRVLRLSQAGSGDVRVASVSERLEATLGGGGDLAVGEASGAAALRVAGSGDVAVGTASLDTLDVVGGGGGDVSVGTGRVGQVTATLSGGSDLHLGATVRDARLVASGGSDIDVARVEGTLTQVATGGGSVTVREPPAGVAQAGGGAAGMPAMPPMPPAPPMPEMPAMPQMPQMPGMPAVTFGVSPHASSRVPGWLAPGLVGVAVLAAAGLAVRARVARRRPASLRDGWGGGVAGGRRTGAGVAPERSRDPEVAVLQQRLAAVEARVAQVERTVTSPEFELHRGFRDLAG